MVNSESFFSFHVACWVRCFVQVAPELPFVVSALFESLGGPEPAAIFVLQPVESLGGP